MCSSSSGQRWYSYVSEICHEHQGQLHLAGALPFSWAYRQRSKISSWLLNFLWIYALFYPDLLSLLAMHECLFLVCTLNKTEMYYKEQIPWTHYVPIASMLRLWESSRPWECFAAQAQLNSTHWKGLFLGFTQRKPHWIPCCHHQPSWEFVPHISNTSLPFAPVKNQGEPQSNWVSLLEREAASATIRITLLDMAVQEVDIVCCHHQLKNGESQPLRHMVSKSKLKTSPFII